ncbi:MAG: DUF721 domain-containing protein [Acidobacteriota bacterium]|nr:DUF721 domain-containing protein [Blastocatellia bacterium]MDW8238460.1 DUF721 domain-containing protein [Acidobacteriota bacterium]
MDELVSLLPSILQRSGYQPDVCEQAAFAAWNHVVGKAVAARCVPFRLHEKHLIVITSDKTWKTQLQKMTSEIIFKIGRVLGAPLVTYIEYRVDPQYVARRQQERPAIVFDRLEQWHAELQADAELIADDELRDIFLRAASKSLARRS